MRHGGHTLASYLAKEYHYCIHTYESARQRICLRAVDLYLHQVKPEYREIEFKDAENSDDPQSDIAANVKKVHGYFRQDRTCHLPFSFSHFIARAIDELYDRGVLVGLQQLIEGEPMFKAERIEDIGVNAQRLTKDFQQVVDLCLLVPTQSLSSLTPETSTELRKRLKAILNTTHQFIGQIDKAAE